jgi:hypothetical protein
VKSCKKCGVSIPDGVDVCRPCAEKYLSPKPEITQQTSIKKEGEKNDFSDDLRDSGFQKGLNWRKNKLEAISKARKTGLQDEQVLRELRLGGITIQKARELMKDSEELLGR